MFNIFDRCHHSGRISHSCDDGSLPIDSSCVQRKRVVHVLESSGHHPRCGKRLPNGGATNGFCMRSLDGTRGCGVRDCRRCHFIKNDKNSSNRFEFYFGVCASFVKGNCVYLT